MPRSGKACPLPYGCRNGACGACRGRITAGRVHLPQGAVAARIDRAGDPGRLDPPLPGPGFVELRIAAPGGRRRRRGPHPPARVASRIRLAHDVMELRLQLPRPNASSTGPVNTSTSCSGRAPARVLPRQLPADDAHLVLHIRHVPGGTFSGHVFEKLEERSLLRPAGSARQLLPSHRQRAPVVFLAGGTGFAPVKAIIENALLTPLGREMHLYWGVRSERDLYLPEATSRVGAGAHPAPLRPGFCRSRSRIGTDAPDWSTSGARRSPGPLRARVYASVRHPW